MYCKPYATFTMYLIFKYLHNCTIGKFLLIGNVFSNWEHLLLYHWGLIKFWYKNTQSNDSLLMWTVQVW